MGTECLIGNNKDNDLQIQSINHKKYSSNMQINKNIKHNSSQNIKEPIHYKTQFQEQGYSLSPNSNFNLYNNKIYSKTLQSKSTSNSNIIDFDKDKKIHNFTNEELQDQVNDILRIRIPFFDNRILKTLSAFTFLSGNGPFHEGLMFFTTNKNFYIAQSYPITFIKVFDFFNGLKEIISFNNINKNSRKYQISEIYCPQEPITLYNVLNIINNLPNKYNLLNDNCQNFCNNILNALNKNFKIEKYDNKNATKINFIKKQKNINIFKTPNYKFNSGRFDNL